MPEPVFTWFRLKDGQQVTEQDRISIKTLQPDGNEKYESRLVVNEVNKDDLGNYRCRVRNVMGDTDVILRLQQKSK